jgi:hypothetical protein
MKERDILGIEYQPTYEIQKKLIHNALEIMDGYSIDFSQYQAPVIWGTSVCTIEIIWTHKKSKQELVLSCIWFSEKTGEILQYGSNYGQLTL